MLVKIGLKEKLIAINELQKERKNIVYQISCINLNKFDEATRILVVKDHKYQGYILPVYGSPGYDILGIIDKNSNEELLNECMKEQKLILESKLKDLKDKLEEIELQIEELLV